VGSLHLAPVARPPWRRVPGSSVDVCTALFYRAAPAVLPLRCCRC